MKSTALLNGSANTKPEDRKRAKKEAPKSRWEKPTLEDVSEKIMAQPYIRFT